MTIRETLNSALSELDALEVGHQQEKNALAETLARATHSDRGTVEVRECQECREPYPEWTKVPAPSICPSCILLSSVPASRSGDSAGRALRHDLQADVAAGAMIHEALRSYALLTGQPQDPEWPEAPGWLRAWRIEMARAVIAGLREPQQAHELWLSARETEGWKYGAVVDPMKRLAPLMLPWKQMHPVEQTKYRLAVAIAAALQ